MTVTTMGTLDERQESLWWMIVSPAIWTAHFLLSYGTVAIWCSRFAPEDGSLGGTRVALAVYTLVALVGVGLAGRDAWRRHRLGGGSVPHDADTHIDRHRFLGLASVLLSALSAVAIIYETLPILFIRTCR